MHVAQQASKEKPVHVYMFFRPPVLLSWSDELPLTSWLYSHRSPVPSLTAMHPILSRSIHLREHCACYTANMAASDASYRDAHHAHGFFVAETTGVCDSHRTLRDARALDLSKLLFFL